MRVVKMVSDNLFRVKIAKGDINYYLLKIWQVEKRFPSLKTLILDAEGKEYIEKAISLACNLELAFFREGLFFRNVNLELESGQIEIIFAKSGA